MLAPSNPDFISLVSIRLLIYPEVKIPVPYFIVEGGCLRVDEDGGVVAAGLYLDTVAPEVTAVILQPRITIRQATLEYAISGMVFSVFVDDLALVLRENGEINMVDACSIEVAKARISNPYTE